MNPTSDSSAAIVALSTLEPNLRALTPSSGKSEADYDAMKSTVPVFHALESMKQDCKPCVPMSKAFVPTDGDKRASPIQVNDTNDGFEDSSMEVVIAQDGEVCFVHPSDIQAGDLKIAERSSFDCVKLEKEEEGKDNSILFSKKRSNEDCFEIDVNYLLEVKKLKKEEQFESSLNESEIELEEEIERLIKCNALREFRDEKEKTNSWMQDMHGERKEGIIPTWQIGINNIGCSEDEKNREKVNKIEIKEQMEDAESEGAGRTEHENDAKKAVEVEEGGRKEDVGFSVGKELHKDNEVIENSKDCKEDCRERMKEKSEGEEEEEEDEDEKEEEKEEDEEDEEEEEKEEKQMGSQGFEIQFSPSKSICLSNEPLSYEKKGNGGKLKDHLKDVFIKNFAREEEDLSQREVVHLKTIGKHHVTYAEYCYHRACRPSKT